MSKPNRHTRDVARAFDGNALRPASLSDSCVDPLPPRIPGTADHSTRGTLRRQDLLRAQGIDLEILARDPSYASPESLAGNIENFIGFARVPIGVIGPLRVRGGSACGDFYVPMATTEGAMLASYQRGSQAISRAGGATTVCLSEAISRCPVFIFDRISTSGSFIAWVTDNYDRLQGVVSKTSRYCKLADLRINVTGKEVYLGFEFTTGDASGQNMVTIATEAICNWLVEHAPMTPVQWFLEANCSGDKKSSMQSLLHVRGKKVVADVEIDRKTVSRFLHTDPETMVRYWQVSAAGAMQSGTVGVQGHYANALAGLFIATGQDVACVAEAHVGITRIDVTADGGLYMSVCLPNLIVGTVGGGTRFPTQRQCLEMLDCYGEGKSRKFAEICAATVLAGEISIVAALCAGHFGQAHAAYGRHKEQAEISSSVEIPKPHFRMRATQPKDAAITEDPTGTN